jgi:ferredoxin
MPDETVTIECGGDEYVWDAAGCQGGWLPSICRQGRCLTCAGQLLSSQVDQSDADTYFPDDKAAEFVPFCQAIPLADLQIRTHMQLEMGEHRHAHGLPALCS